MTPAQWPLMSYNLFKFPVGFLGFIFLEVLKDLIVRHHLVVYLLPDLDTEFHSFGVLIYVLQVDYLFNFDSWSGPVVTWFLEECSAYEVL